MSMLTFISDVSDVLYDISLVNVCCAYILINTMVYGNKEVN